MAATHLWGQLGQINGKQLARNYLLLSLGVVTASLSFHFFMKTINVAPGGVTGLALIINKFTGWSNGTILLCLQIPMLVLGFFYLGRFRFLARTLYFTIGYSFMIDLLAWLIPTSGLSPDPLLNAIYGGVLGGIGTGFIYRANATTAGTSVISRIIQRKTGLPVSQTYLYVDGVIIVGLGLVFGWENALYALIMLFVWGVATDYSMEGPSVIRTAFIVTDQPRAVADALFARTGLGVTGWQGQGMFTNENRAVLFCTVRRPDVEGLRSAVLETDPKAFLVIGQGHQAQGGVLPGSPD